MRAYALKIGRSIQLDSIELDRGRVFEGLTPKELDMMKNGKAAIIRISITQSNYKK